MRAGSGFPLVVGLIGCGAVGSKHLAAIRQVSELKLVSVYDSDQVRAASVAPSGTRVCPTLDALLGESDVDLVVIATPSGTHARLATLALQAEKHAVVEKPIGLNGEEVAVLEAAARKQGRRVFAVHQRRLDAHLVSLKEAYDAGAFGRVSCVSVDLLWYRPQSYFDAALWRGRAEEAGGVLLNQGLHVLDFMLWVVGPPATTYAAAARRSLNVEFEDNLVGVLTFGDGFSGSVRASLTAYPRNLLESVSIVGSEGTVIIGGANLDKVAVWEFSDRRPAPQVGPLAGHLGFYRALAAQMRGGVTCPPALPTIADSALVVRVAQALQKSAILGRPISLSEDGWVSGGGRR